MILTTSWNRGQQHRMRKQFNRLVLSFSSLSSVGCLALILLAFLHCETARAIGVTVFATPSSPSDSDSYYSLLPNSPTTMYYSFNYPGPATTTGTFFYASISGNAGGWGVGATCNYQGCAPPPAPGNSGRYDRPFGDVAISASISVSPAFNNSAFGSVAVSFGGSEDFPEKYDNLIASGLENNTRTTPTPGPDPCEAECTSEQGEEQVSGAMLVSDKLAVPVFAEHGLTDYVWANAAISESPTAEPWRAGYFFDSEIPFTHFKIPDALPSGDDEYEIRVNRDEIYTLEAGVPFNFTEFYPEGVFGFVLTGFDYDDGMAAGYPFPYTHGYRFAEEGGTIIHHGSILPGDFSMGGLVDEYDLAIWQESFGVDGGADADGDGDSDGRDFLIWQRNYYPGEDQPAVTATVPEPGGLVLLVGGLLVVGRRGACAVQFICPAAEAGSPAACQTGRTLLRDSVPKI